MEFCDNKRQLFQAYFRDFSIERLDRPWKAFTGGWHPDVAAKKLGINSSFIHGDYCYVLVRVSRFRESSLFTRPIPANQPLEDAVRQEIGEYLCICSLVHSLTALTSRRQNQGGRHNGRR